MIDPTELMIRLEARRDGPLPAGAAALAKRVAQQAPAFGVEQPDEVLEVFDLWLSLTERAPGSDYVQGILRVVLSLRRWTVAARIAFLRRHLAGRTITADDDANARGLFGLREEAGT